MLLLLWCACWPFLYCHFPSLQLFLLCLCHEIIVIYLDLSVPTRHIFRCVVCLFNFVCCCRRRAVVFVAENETFRQHKIAEGNRHTENKTLQKRIGNEGNNDGNCHNEAHLEFTMAKKTENTIRLCVRACVCIVENEIRKYWMVKNACWTDYFKYVWHIRTHIVNNHWFSWVLLPVCSLPFEAFYGKHANRKRISTALKQLLVGARVRWVMIPIFDRTHLNSINIFFYFHFSFVSSTQITYMLTNFVWIQYSKPNRIWFCRKAKKKNRSLENRFRRSCVRLYVNFWRPIRPCMQNSWNRKK